LDDKSVLKLFFVDQPGLYQELSEQCPIHTIEFTINRLFLKGEVCASNKLGSVPLNYGYLSVKTVTINFSSYL
jgi:hypothetical protein